MPSWLCKIWKLIVNIVDKVLKVIVGAVKSLLDVAVAALESLADAVFDSGIFKWLLLGAGAWLLFGVLKDDDKDKSSTLKLES